MAPLPLLLITGTSGYIGSHVLREAVLAGYPVRVTARPGKSEALAKLYDGKIEVVEIADLAKDDYTKALKDVGAVIHVASPIPGKTDLAGMLTGAVDGTLNILRQAIALGVKKFVVTGTIGSAVDPSKMSVVFSDYVYNENNWNPATMESTVSGTVTDPVLIYAAAKTISEKEVWKLVDEHPEIDVTSVCPTSTFGPAVPGIRLSKEALPAYSTFGVFYQNVLPENGSKAKVGDGPQVFPMTVDVRDVAKAHILALAAPPSAEVGRKRLLLSGPRLTWKAAVEHLLSVRPELKDRLPDGSEAADITVASVDSSKVKEVLGPDFKFTPWQKTVDDTIDSLLAIEGEWKA